MKEFRCKTCGKLLCKGYLKDSGSLLEVKCRSCGEMNTFTGPDAASRLQDLGIVDEELIANQEDDEVTV